MLRATLLYWRKKLGRSFVATTLVLVATIALFAVLGAEGWFLAVLVTLVVVAALLPLYALFYARRAARTSLRKLDPPSAQVELAPDGFTMTTSMGSSKMKWSAVNELWRAPEFTLVFFAEETFVVLPAAGAPAEFHDLFAERVRAAGGKVR
jgi:hypothetical protein